MGGKFGGSEETYEAEGKTIGGGSRPRKKPGNLT